MSNRLKELRKIKGLTLKDIQEQTGIKRSTYSDYENENTEPKLAVWKDLADFFDVDVGYLQGFSTVPKIPKGTVIRHFDDNYQRITKLPEGLPKNTTFFDIEQDELMNHKANKATPLLKTILPSPLAEQTDEELSSYADRFNYVMAMESASSTFLSLLEEPRAETKDAVNAMLYSIIESVYDLYSDKTINLEDFIEELSKIRKHYTSPENYDNNIVPWK